jgi:hypothetical protein
MEPEESMTCSKQPVNISYLELENPINTLSPYGCILKLACTFQDASSLQISKQNFAFILIPPMRAT